MKRLFRHRGFARMFLVGVGVGVGLLAWLSLGPGLWGGAIWFPFDPGALIDDLSVRARPLEVPFEGSGLLFWGAAFGLLPAGFAAFWRLVRGEEVALARQLEMAERKAERRAAFAAAERAWAAAEASEAAGDREGQLRHLDEYLAHARHLEMTEDARADRVTQIRDAAARIEASDPEGAVRLLREAQRMLSSRGPSAALWTHIRLDVLGYVLGASSALAVFPLALLIVLGLVGLVLWTLKMVLAVLVVLALIVLLIVYVAN